MILTALKQYYDRLRAEPDKKDAIPEFSFSSEKIDFALVLNKNGNLVSVEDVRDTSGKKPISRRMLVPQSVKRSVNIAPNFMWDNTAYVLAVDAKVHKDKDRPWNMFDAFKELHHQIGDNIDDEAMRALLNFLDNWNPEKATELKYWDEMAGRNVVFKFDGEKQYFHERDAIKKAWKEHLQSKEIEYEAICLVTGDKSQITRLHSSIKGVQGAQPSGANIISFNLDAFESYGKEQSFNAPVSIEAAFEYTTALNYLLRRGSEQKIQIGDATTVFWAERKTKMEQLFGVLINPPTTSELEEDKSTTKDLKDFFSAIRKGEMPMTIGTDKDVRFYVLGLSPNASRISVRFWYASTVEDIAVKIGKHFSDIAIEKQFDNEFENPGIWHLLLETAVGHKSDNIPPLLSGELMRSILTGGNYPESLLSAIIGRIRADQKVNYHRASLIKGVLTRNHNKEVSMSLNKDNREIPYLLGRLFAVLEAAQKDASNETIRERYFGSASATPQKVFPLLLSLTQHHIAKGEHGTRYDRLTAEIMENLPDRKFPAHLPLQEQGLFAIGYYHQRNDLFKKHEKVEETETNEQ